MPSRRLFLVGALSAFSLPVTAQGRKAAGDGDAQPTLIAGRYSARGMNADGSRYDGRVEIVQMGDAVEFTWVIGNDTFRGTGQITGQVVMVDWGDQHPVAYIIMPDKELHGIWADGQALEKLTPL